MLMVDEAHATGVLGAGGAGAVAMLGLSDRVTVQMGTLGKAIGAFGAFVAAAEPVIELLVNAARSFVFTTALPPPVVASARTGLAIARGADDRRMQLRHNAARLIDGLLGLGFDLPARLCRAGEDQPTHIIPVMVGDAERTMAWSEALLDRGAFVQGIRPPTVPEGTSRLRATPMATHSAADIDQALAAFGSLATDAARRLRAVC